MSEKQSEKMVEGAPLSKQVILNGPYSEPQRHWHYEELERQHRMEETRRKSSYIRQEVVGSGARRRVYQRPKELELVNEIRPLIQDWRLGNWEEATDVSRELLVHWSKREERDRRLFFCQLEAAETMIWLSETAAGREFSGRIAGDGSPFPRLCAKLATGTGKTVVMAMLAAWQALNRLSSPGNSRYSSDILAVAPGLTVKRRLGAIVPGAPGNCYDDFDLIPSDFREMMNRARVLPINWHALLPDKGEIRSVDKRGPKSDEAWARSVLEDKMKDARDFVVFNDEAHHAWRAKSGEAKEDDLSTIWIRGLDRLFQTRGILRCYDFSATPFASPGGLVDDNSVFNWVVSDFGLNDAIESGLVKIPRLVVRDGVQDDAKTGKSKFWHIYPHVEKELKRRDGPLPGLLIQAYAHLGADWASYRDAFREADPPHETPPVMITVTNNTRSARRIEDALQANALLKGACLPDRTVRIDSSVLKKGEDESKMDELRRIVDTVGQPGKPGADVEHVISVAMLSEGWDAKTVTHIMGLRAFSSQLLCEQVVGRGLRRMSYDLGEDGMFQPEYVNVFGVPFDLALRGDPDDKSVPKAAADRRLIYPDPEKSEFELSWPRVLRVNAVFSRILKEPDWSNVQRLELSGAQILDHPELGPLLDSRVDESAAEKMRLGELDKRFRMQRLAFEAAASVAWKHAKDWGGNSAALAAQLVGFAEKFISQKVYIRPALPPGELNDIRYRLLIGLSFGRILDRFADLVDSENTERLEVVLDNQTTGTTGDVRPWYTVRMCALARKSHMNLCPYDSKWEESTAGMLDASSDVVAWVKNDLNLRFEILWSDGGTPGKYIPDFLVKLRDGRMMILEITGKQFMFPEMAGEVEAKKRAAERWVEAVNNHGKFGQWFFRQAEDPEEVPGIITDFFGKDSPA